MYKLECSAMNRMDRSAASTPRASRKPLAWAKADELPNPPRVKMTTGDKKYHRALNVSLQISMRIR